MPNLISFHNPVHPISFHLFFPLSRTPWGSSRPPPSLSALFAGSVGLPTERFGQEERGKGVWHVDQCLWSPWGLQSSLFHLISTVLTLWSHTQQRSNWIWGSGEGHMETTRFSLFSHLNCPDFVFLESFWNFYKYKYKYKYKWQHLSSNPLSF